MKKNELLRNIGFTTIPVCLVIYGISFYLSGGSIWAAFIPVILLTASIHSNVMKYKDDINIEKAGFTKHLFQIQRVFDLVTPNDSISPSLCLEIENDKYLLLNGQWLYDSEIYGDGAKNNYDSESDIFNCHTGSSSFPSSEFELWVSNLDRKPHRIVTKGEYIEPEVVSWETPEKYYDKMFAVISRSEINKEKKA